MFNRTGNFFQLTFPLSERDLNKSENPHLTGNHFCPKMGCFFSYQTHFNVTKNVKARGRFPIEIDT